MSLLWRTPPRGVWLGGEEVPIRTDYRIGIQFERLLWDERAEDWQRVLLGLRLYYAPEALARFGAGELWAAAVAFYAGGEARGRGPGRQRRLYDWDMDGDLCYAALRAQYGLDVRAAGLHWWEFRALVQGLDAGCAFCRRMAVRGTELADMPDGQARARLAQAKALIKI